MVEAMEQSFNDGLFHIELEPEKSVALCVLFFGVAITYQAEVALKPGL